MDRAISSPPNGAHRGPEQGGPSETLDTPQPADAVSETDTSRPAPRTLPPIPESEPLLHEPLGASALGDSQRKPNGRSLHVKFDAQSPPAPVSSSSSSSSSSDDEDVSIAEARPPDGGWGWVVVFASFMVNLIADGITFSFGVFFPHFLEYFGEGKGKTAWIAGIFMAMPLLSGPIASFLTDRYGCRRMTIFGSVLAAVGFVISAFVDNMETLFLTFGIMAGFGLSLCYVAAVVIVAYYFEKKRSLATGISVCGSGIGTFIFAPLTNVLLDEYGWRGTTLILAGLFLNMAVCGLLMKDLPWTATMNEEKAKERKRRRERKRNKRYGSSVDSFSDSKSSAAGSTKVVDNVDIEAVTSPIVPQFSSLVDLPTFMTGGEGVSLEVFELMSNRGRAYAMLAQNYPGVMLPSRSFSDSGRLNEQSPPRALMSPGVLSPGAMSPTSAPTANGNAAPLSEKAALSLWLRKQATSGVVPKKPPAFFKDLRVHRHSLTYRGAMLNINRYRLRASSCPNIFRNSMTTIAREKVQWYAGLWDFWDLVVDVLDFSHFLNPPFLFFALSNFLLYMWYDVPYVYIADHGLSMGFNESQASMLISVIGILNMFGEILLGWVGDWECVNASLVYAACMLLCGFVTLLMPLLTDYFTLAAASGAFGAFIAANYSLTSIILVEQITLEKFTNAYGLLLLMQGLANLIGPPLAGWIYDITDSYDLSFYLAGAFIGVSGVILVILPLYAQARRYNELRKRAPPAPPAEEPKLNGEVKQNGKVKLIV
ncbi:monocarboxylate transporter 9-like [Pectinophora gossypiella]|uniref:monocarboxylate transporter 9-like n=1 Tax=Pectinophora gossypiella TaxID=13191 RepID=UPI00214EF4BD|nr:monocarboxylate transporter 9-like [Pectinophora gossypiella]XP_049869477.1 monocarboxylate transporter 9-like [Pectinophora gossypiella]XP_049869478.1 monocarboxylate transporter 9-like [Pectinophora gossypiella]